LQPGEFSILAINPGSTSTKMALYANERPGFVANIRHSDDELAQFRDGPFLISSNFAARGLKPRSVRQDTTSASFTRW